MGSSHFINSMGSLWGIERDEETGRSYFLGGTQRFTGTQAATQLELNDNGWFEVVSEFDTNLELAVNTEKRRLAWSLLPRGPFTYMEGVNAAKPALKSQGSFNPWWRELLRLELVLPCADGKYLTGPFLSM